MVPRRIELRSHPRQGCVLSHWTMGPYDLGVSKIFKSNVLLITSINLYT